MALSQLQCLDDNHVNPRTNETKPDFLYCEDQRLALEALLRDGREAFFKFLEARGLRGFLSDPELDALFAAAEPYDPDTELFLEDAEEGDPPLSLHYWPELSDTSVPEMDLGWPDCESYRGVTRTTIYSQPPLEGQVHVKEIVRRTIAQAQKVIAVVMDVFTDVDIFRDLLDAGFKRKVSVYILLERTALPHFLSMCQRANMHAGHLKHLRVRCLEGVGFYTRSSTLVRGRMGHRFMFIDGDKAVSGSYSFTWMSSRLDRSLITVITGQAVETFDRLFRIMFATSTSVNLRQVATEPEPLPDPVPQPVTVVVPSAAVARKLYNPKYALALGNTSPSSSPTPSAGHNNTKKTESDNNSGNMEAKDTKKRGRRRASKELLQEAPPLHPGLTNLEKACLITYLPTWPEPDPPSDVIGFINIRDTSKPPPVHLQRSEMFETSQAIRFSSPVSIPKQTLSDVAKPRQLTVKKEEVNKPPQDKTKGEELTQLDARSCDVKGKPKEPEKDSPGPEPKSHSVKNSLDADKVHTDSSSSRDAGYSSTTPFSERSSSQFSRKTSTPSPTAGLVAQTTQVVPTKDLRPDTLLTSDCAKGETSSNTQPESNGSSQFGGNEHQTQRQLPHTDSHTQAAHTKNLSEIAQHIQKPTIKNPRSPSPTPVGLTSLSEKVAPTANRTSITPLPSISPSLHSSFTSNNANPPSSLPSSSSASTPPIPKPRTIQLFIEESIVSEGQKKLDLSVLKRLQTAAATDTPKKPSEKENEILARQQSKAGVSKDKDSSEILMKAPKPKQSRNSQEVKMREVVGLRDVKDGLKTVAGTNPDSLSDVLITDTTKAESVNVPVKNPQEGTEILTSVDCKSETKSPNKVRKSFEYPEVPTENNKYVTQHKTYFLSTHNPQRILYSASTSRDTDELVTSDSQKASTHTPASATYNPHISKDTGGEHTQANSHFPAACRASNEQNTTNTHGNLPELNPKARASTHTPEKSLCLHLSDTNTKESFSPTAEREPRLLTPRTRTTTPDALTHTPDQKSLTTDFRTPTPDISDGYLSALSTTSEEFYECCESPLNDNVFDRAVFSSYSAKDDHVGFPCTSSPNASGVAPSPVCISYSATTERNTSISDRKTLSRPTSASSVSSLLEEKDKKRENEINEKIWREVDAISLKVSTSERGAEEDVKRVQRRVSKDEKSTADHLKQTKDLTEVVKTTEAQPQGSGRRRLHSQSKAERLVDGGRTLGELTTEKTEPKRSSTGDLRAKKAPSEGEKSDKEKAVDRAASGSSSLERKGKTQSAKEGQKPVPTAPRTPRAQQQDGVAASSSAQSKPPRPPVGPRPSGSRQAGSHSEGKTPHGGHQDNTSPPLKPPSRPPPLSSPTPGRKHQADISHGQQSPVSRHPPASPGRAKGRQTSNQHSQAKSLASFFHNSAQQHSPPPKNQSVSPEEAEGQGEGKTGFGIGFRMYNFMAIKDRMSKMPTQSKKGSSSPTAHARKSSS